MEKPGVSTADLRFDPIVSSGVAARGSTRARIPREAGPPAGQSYAYRDQRTAYIESRQAFGRVVMTP